MPCCRLFDSGQEPAFMSVCLTVGSESRFLNQPLRPSLCELQDVYDRHRYLDGDDRMSLHWAPSRSCPCVGAYRNGSNPRDGSGIASISTMEMLDTAARWCVFGFLLLLLWGVKPAFSYSLLTHEQIID